MSNQHMMTDANAVIDFMFAGKARFTLVSQRTGIRYTYRVREAKEARNNSKAYFVSVLTGSDNESSYTFLGTIFGKLGEYRHGHKSTVPHNDSRVVAFEWFYYSIQRRRLANNLEFWHEGRCGKCGRTLTVPSSIQTGFGPECVLTIKGLASSEPQLPFPH